MEYTDSILDTIKKLLGPTQEYTYFDQDIIIHINTAIMHLTDIGVGPKEGFSIKSSEEVWSDFIKDIKQFEAVKTYIYLKVKLIFDPPLSSSVIELFEKQISEIEWRLNSRVDHPVE